MQFIVKASTPALKSVLSLRTMFMAKSLILVYPFGASERMLDTYLREHFQMGLRDCCLSILFKLTKSSESSDSIIFTLVDDYWDTLAQLITCGVGDLPGSRILLDSIKGIYQ
jgi:hypothetical protein